MGDEEARALKRDRTAAQIERFERSRRVFVGVKFSVVPHQPRCAEAARLDGQLLTDPPMLPLKSCDRPRCYCAWRGVTAWELRRKVEDQG